MLEDAPVLVDVHGQEVLLETRTCAGGCGKKFRCMPSSTVQTARADCAHACSKNSRRPFEEPHPDKTRDWTAKYTAGTQPDVAPRKKKSG